MKIFLEALGISEYGGGRSSIMELLHAIAVHDEIESVHVWLDQYETELGAHAKIKQHVIKSRNRMLSRLLAWPSLVIWQLRVRPHLIHFSKNQSLPFMRVPAVVTVHDLANLRRPEIFPVYDTWFWKYIQPIALRRADSIIAISTTTSKDLQSLFGISASKIDIIPWSLRPQFRPASSAQRALIREKYGLHLPYVVHVGAISPKKNLVTLVRAVHRLQSMGMACELVLIGPMYYKMKDDLLLPAIDELQMGGKVRFLGAVVDEDIPGLLSAAEVFAFPSLYEGFGLAPIEAIACGTPVVIADEGGALTEVMGDASLGYSPITDDCALANAILSAGSTHRDKLVRSGLSWSAKFGRDELSNRTIRAYRHALELRRLVT